MTTYYADNIQKTDQIAHHFYTKLFHVVNHARATEQDGQGKVDKWFNIETPDSELFSKSAQRPWKYISSYWHPDEPTDNAGMHRRVSSSSSSSSAPSSTGMKGPPPLEIQVLLSIPDLTNTQALVCTTGPGGQRLRIDPTPRHVLLETWTLTFVPHSPRPDPTHLELMPPTIYKHVIALFRSVYSMLRVLPSWAVYKRLRRRTGALTRGGLGIWVRVADGDIGRVLTFDEPPSIGQPPLQKATHTFPSVTHQLGSFILSTTYLSVPNFQLDELESLLSSRFLSLDLEGFVPTLHKSSSSASATASTPASSPPRSSNPADIDRFIIPSSGRSTVAPSIGYSASTGSSALIPPPRPTIPSTIPIPDRLRRTSLNSSSSSSLGVHSSSVQPGLGSVPSSPSVSGVPIRRPSATVSAFKSNTLSSSPARAPLSSSPLSNGSFHIRAGSSSSAGGGGGVGQRSGHPPPSPVSTGVVGSYGAPLPSPLSSVAGPSPAVGTAPFPFSSSSASGRPLSGSTGSGSDGGSVQIPTRKRYSSNFGHRFSGSGGVTTPGGGGGGDTSGRSTPADGKGPLSSLGMGGGIGVGIGIGGGGAQGVGQTDDDDISIFVQEIDARKPLSGREREEREREAGLSRRSSLGLNGPGHDRFRTDSTDTTVRPLHYQHGHGRTMTSVSPPSPLSSSPGGRPSRFVSSPSPISTSTTTPTAIAGIMGTGTATTSTLPHNPDPPMLRRGGVTGGSDGSAGSVPIVNSQLEVEDRLKKMNDTFLKSLEGIGRKGSRGSESPRTTTTTTTTTSAFASSSSGRLGPLVISGAGGGGGTTTGPSALPASSTTTRMSRDEVVSPTFSSPLAIVRPFGAGGSARGVGVDGEDGGDADGGYMDPNEFAWDLDHSPSRPICRKPYSPYSYDGR